MRTGPVYVGDAVLITVPENYKTDYGTLSGQRGRLMGLRGSTAEVQLQKTRVTVLAAWLSPAPRW